MNKYFRIAEIFQVKQQKIKNKKVIAQNVANTTILFFVFFLNHSINTNDKLYTFWSLRFTPNLHMPYF